MLPEVKVSLKDYEILYTLARRALWVATPGMDRMFSLHDVAKETANSFGLVTLDDFNEFLVRLKIEN